jgi:hypothetical protein
MSNLTVKLPHRALGDWVETACRRFDTCLADRLVAAAEADDGELLMSLLDVVEWIDTTRLVAAVSAPLN